MVRGPGRRTWQGHRRHPQPIDRSKNIRMETRANHLVIGSFVLVTIVGLFGFVIWLAKVDIDREFSYFDIFFDNSVTGLSVGGDVRFNGIPVGAVTEISIDPVNPSRVRVRIEVATEVPIRADTKASLEFQGITGVSYVQLSGGSAEKPLLVAAKQGEVPEIESVPSALQELFQGAPDLIDRVIVLVNRAALILNKDNQERFARILENVDGFTTNLKERGPQIENILANVDQMSTDMRQAVQAVNALVKRVDDVMKNADGTMSVARGTMIGVNEIIEHDFKLLVRDIRTAAVNIDKLSQSFRGFIEKNEEPLDLFASQGLVEFTKFIEEARLLVASISRLTEDLETDPAQFLFGSQRGGVEAK